MPQFVLSVPDYQSMTANSPLSRFTELRILSTNAVRGAQTCQPLSAAYNEFAIRYQLTMNSSQPIGIIGVGRKNSVGFTGRGFAPIYL